MLPASASAEERVVLLLQQYYNRKLYYSEAVCDMVMTANILLA